MIIRVISGCELNAYGSLARDLILPLWKSNVSVTLMIDKKAKRCVWLRVCSVVHHSHLLSRSALSLRLFGEDVTIAAREVGKKKRLAASSATRANEPEPGSEHDADGDSDNDENDMDAEDEG